MGDDKEIYCGDEETVKLLYENLGRPALSKTLYLVSRTDVAEDIVQDVFVKLWQKKARFPSMRSAYAWVYRCCTNAAIDHLRSKGSQVLPLEDIENQVSSTSQIEEQVDLKETLASVLKNLGEKEASVFIHQVIEGLTQNEIAEVMGISRRTVARLQIKVNQRLTKIRKARYAG